MNDLSATFVLVLGIGESGLAMARWVAREGGRLRIADSRREPPALDALMRLVPDAEVVLGEFDEKLLDGVDLVAVSPGIDLRDKFVVAARKAGVPVVGEMTLFAQALERLGARSATRIVAITGTNGKSTTTALAAAMYRAAGLDAVAAGNISPAALTLLVDRLDDGEALPECWVLELSSFQIESMDGLNPQAATVLNITDDHLDRHGDIADYARIKARIFQGDGVQILNRQDSRVMAMALPGRAKITFGTDAPTSSADYGIVMRDGEPCLSRGGEVLLAGARLKLAGQHNATNALAALALGEAIGCSLPPMLEALIGFTGLPHRMTPVGWRDDGVIFYDDSKGTNVGSTVAALEGLGRPVVLIAGGDGKGQDFSPLRDVVARHARAVVLIGRDAPCIEAALEGMDVRLARARDMDEAVVCAATLASSGDAVLLSPACASLDMFRNYVHRAEAFCAAVSRLPGVRAS